MDFKPKLVAFDLDGTLAESKQRMTARMGELLGELLQQMPVAVMSGAGFSQFEKQFLSALPEGAGVKNLYIFPTNAARCYVFESKAWRTAYDEAFTLIEKNRIMEALRESLAETHLAAEGTAGEQIEDRGAQITFSALGQSASLEAKEAWKQAHEEERKNLRALIAQRLPEFSVATGGLTSIDITRKGITKAYGIRKLAGLSGISVSEMLYVGDALEAGGNDYVVIETGVRTQSVFGPEETAKLIEEIIAQHAVVAA